MPINSLINRYRDLVNQIPKGSFYSNDGNIVPMRDNPYVIRFTTNSPNTQFGVFVNNIYTGVVQSDAQGNVTTSVLPKLGENELSIVNSVTQERTISYLTTRNYATWLASIAEVFEELDNFIDLTQLDSGLATASSSGLDEVWGVRANQSNVGYEPDAYRETLQALLLGYRLFGAKFRGIELAVASFTQIPPLIYQRRFDGKRWILGSDFLVNRTFETIEFAFNPTPSLPGLTLESIGWIANTGSTTLGWVSGGTISVSGTVDLNTLTYGKGGSVDGLTLVISNEAGAFQTVKFNQPASGGDLTDQINRSIQGIESYIGVGNVLVIKSTLLGSTSFIKVERYGTALPIVGLLEQLITGNDNLITYIDPILGLFTKLTSPRFDGLVDIPGPRFPARSLSIAGPFNITPGNQLLEFDIDSRGVIDILLPLGAQTATSLATFINTALLLDVRYGITYSNSIQVAVGSPRIRIDSSDGGSIEIYPTTGSIYLFNITAPEKYLGYQPIIATVRVVNAATDVSNSVVFQTYRSPLPENWFAFGASAKVVARQGQQFSTGPQCLQLTATGSGEITLYQKAIVQANKYKEFLFDWGMWLSPTVNISATLGWSFDNGTTWNEGTTIALSKLDDPNQLPKFIRSTFRYDADALSLTVRVRISGLTAGQTVVVDSARLLQPNVTAMFLARNTIIRSRKRSYFGELLWSWCSDPLTADESTSIGLGSPPNWPVGTIDQIAAAQNQIDRFDVSEFDLVSGLSKNLMGVINESDWSMATLTNLDLIPRDPSRASFVQPSVADVVTDSLTFPNAPPYRATLSLVSDQDQGQAVLFEDGTPLPNDKWFFSLANQITVDTSSYNPNALYTVSYLPLWQAETQIIDLGSGFQDYVWYGDHYRFTRFDTDKTKTLKSRYLYLDFTTFEAVLDFPAVPDINLTTIVRDNGLDKVELTKDSFIWVDQYTVRLAAQAVIPTALYTMTYYEVGMKNEELPQVLFETRGGATASDCQSASYKTITRNQALRTSTGFRYHQFRLTATNIKYVTDFRLSSIVAKGLNVFGSQSVPGLVP